MGFTDEQKSEIKRKLEKEKDNRKQHLSKIIKDGDKSKFAGADVFAGATEDIVKKKIRNRGIASIIWGIIWIIIGTLGGGRDFILSIGGLILITEGITLVFYQRPALIILDGSLMIGIGILNIALSMISGIAGEGRLNAFWWRLGFIQIIWGAVSIMSYQRWKHSLSVAKTK